MRRGQWRVERTVVTWKRLVSDARSDVKRTEPVTEEIEKLSRSAAARIVSSEDLLISPHS